MRSDGHSVRACKRCWRRVSVCGATRSISSRKSFSAGTAHLEASSLTPAIAASWRRGSAGSEATRSISRSSPSVLSRSLTAYASNCQTSQASLIERLPSRRQNARIASWSPRFQASDREGWRARSDGSIESAHSILQIRLPTRPLTSESGFSRDAIRAGSAFSPTAKSKPCARSRTSTEGSAKSRMRSSGFCPSWKTTIPSRKANSRTAHLFSVKTGGRGPGVRQSRQSAEGTFASFGRPTPSNRRRGVPRRGTIRKEGAVDIPWASLLPARYLMGSFRHCSQVSNALRGLPSPSRRPVSLKSR